MIESHYLLYDGDCCDPCKVCRQAEADISRGQTSD